MAEWLSYSLSDFLMFSPGTYHRQFELLNAALWPFHLLAAALGAAMVILLWTRADWQGRAIAGILAAGWLVAGWAYHLDRFSEINAAAPWFAGLFFGQALLLAWTALRREPPRFLVPKGFAGASGVALLIFGFLVQPWIGVLAGQRWTGAESFAVAPDPTVTVTIAVLLLASRIQWSLLAAPLLWCVISGLTYAAMDSTRMLLMPAVAIAGIGLAMARRRFPAR